MEVGELLLTVRAGGVGRKAHRAAGFPGKAWEAVAAGWGSAGHRLGHTSSGGEVSAVRLCGDMIPLCKKEVGSLERV